VGPKAVWTRRREKELPPPGMEARPSGLRAGSPFAVRTDSSADGTRGGIKTNMTGNMPLT
jgi:hypothetical protein